MGDIQELQEKLEALKRLNRNRFDYVLARAHQPSIDAAVKEIGLSPSWYYKFPEEERNELETLADELHYEARIQAILILEQATIEAARVKVDGLKSKDKRLAQDAATEILDRNLGKALQPTDITSAGEPLTVKIIKASMDDL